MSDAEQTQIYLLTPPDVSLNWISETLAPVLDAVPIACLRFGSGSNDPVEIGRLADHLRHTAHARDVPVVIEAHYKLAAPHGLDGVHLMAHTHYRDARKLLGADAIVGCACGTSRHQGLTAGEMGADYVSFGPIGPDPLAPGAPAERDLFAWWSEMVEVPVVAEGMVSLKDAARYAPVADFIAIGAELWSAESPEDMAQNYLSAIREKGL